MTMLDRMRRHKGWLKWSLALVVLAFVFFYVPDFLRPRSGGAGPSEEVAVVNGEGITAGEFRRAYQQQIQAYRAAYGASVDEEMLKRLGVEQQVLRQLVDESAAVAEARRLGLKVSDAEVAQRIFAIPAFQQNGVFAGEDVYSRVLASQNPPLSKAEFEESLRRSLLVDKLRAALTEWLTVSDGDVAAEFARRNEKVKAELVSISADALRDKVQVTDQDLSAWFEAHKEDYRVGEKKKIRFLVVDTEKIRATITVPPADIEQYYRQNIAQFTTPEQIRASHILLKTEGKDEAAVRAQAEDLLKQIKAGADFATLARKYSEDEQSAKLGGDLDYFGRGRMVKAFEDAAFALQPGQVSDVVQSPFGFHIIKVVDRKPETVRPLADARQQIADQIAYQRAQAQATALADEIAPQLKTAADLDKVAAAHGLTVEESGFFDKDEPVAGLGPAPEVTEQAFTVKEGTVAGPARVARGLVFFSPVGSQPSRLPALSEVTQKVRDDVVKQKAQDLATEKAAALATSLKGNFAQAAKAAGLEVKTTELVTRGTAWPGVGVNAALDDAIFAQPVGGTTAPVGTGTATVIAHVLEHESVKPDDEAKAADALRRELESDRRGRFFAAYMVKARNRMKIQVNDEVLKAITG
jgi:peptidyl-prolyl cis-trans isomerase D